MTASPRNVFKTRLVAVAIALVTGAVVSGCAGPSPTPAPTPSATPSPSPTVNPDPARFTDFTLPSASGSDVTFSDLHGQAPLVVVFYRGSFCSICRIQLRELQETYPQFQSLGAEVIAISTDDRADAQDLAATLSLSFPVLYDTDAVVARAWRVFDLNGDGVAAPATFVFNGAGDLIAQRIGVDAGDRPSAAETLEVVRQSLQGGVT